MNYTCQSEYLPLYEVFIKTAEDAFRSTAKIDQEWQALNFADKPDFNKAILEYNAFLQLVESAQVNIHLLPPEDTLSLDALYCRDASIATDHGMIICNMGKERRKMEPKAQKKAFLAHNMAVLGTIEAPGTLEGGDVAWLDRNTLAVGHSYRTNQEGIRQLEQLLRPHGVEVLTVDLPHYRGVSDVFHLMSIFSPVDKDLAAVYSPLMPIRFRNTLVERGYELVEVPDGEFESMGCNVLALAPRKCILVEGNQRTKKLLETFGCEVLTYRGEEISVKGGGGPTCLTRPIRRIL
ncbi:MAG: arginine deiminase family protein [Maribacter sp.]|nr:arginine deiminase family protein [Maribacter sp.]